jgi:hypothetical protein
MARRSRSEPSTEELLRQMSQARKAVEQARHQAQRHLDSVMSGHRNEACSLRAVVRQQRAALAEQDLLSTCLLEWETACERNQRLQHQEHRGLQQRGRRLCSCVFRVWRRHIRLLYREAQVALRADLRRMTTTIDTSSSRGGGGGGGADSTRWVETTQHHTKQTLESLKDAHRKYAARSRVANDQYEVLETELRSMRQCNAEATPKRDSELAGADAVDFDSAPSQQQQQQQQQQRLLVTEMAERSRIAKSRNRELQGRRQALTAASPLATATENSCSPPLPLPSKPPSQEAGSPRRAISQPVPVGPPPLPRKHGARIGRLERLETVLRSKLQGEVQARRIVEEQRELLRRRLGRVERAATAFGAEAEAVLENAECESEAPSVTQKLKTDQAQAIAQAQEEVAKKKQQLIQVEMLLETAKKSQMAQQRVLSNQTDQFAEGMQATVTAEVALPDKQHSEAASDRFLMAKERRGAAQSGLEMQRQQLPLVQKQLHSVRELHRDSTLEASDDESQRLGQQVTEESTKAALLFENAANVERALVAMRAELLEAQETMCSIRTDMMAHRRGRCQQLRDNTTENDRLQHLQQLGATDEKATRALVKTLEVDQQTLDQRMLALREQLAQLQMEEATSQEASTWQLLHSKCQETQVNALCDDETHRQWEQRALIDVRGQQIHEQWAQKEKALLQEALLQGHRN